MTDLLTIIYASSAIDLFSDKDLDNLLSDAIAFNKRNSITGVLLYSDGNFMQCIEGTESSVLKTYERIISSKRHHNIIELYRGQIEHRSFASWAMGMSKPKKSDFYNLTNAISEVSNTKASSEESPQLHLLNNFISVVGEK